MIGDEIRAEGKRTNFRQLLAAALLILVLVPLHLPSQAPASDSEAVRTGTLANLHSDKRVVQSGRWFLVREFTVDFAVRDAAIYCGEITTTDATEAHDLMDSNGQSVEFVEKGKDLYLTLKSGRRIRAHRLSAEKCPRA